ncbi:hypothetical protein L0Y49_02800 [bacterium]|nr:hypothetical protein [bacterium]
MSTKNAKPVLADGVHTISQTKKTKMIVFVHVDKNGKKVSLTRHIRLKDGKWTDRDGNTYE